MTSRTKWLWGLGLAVLLGGAAGFYGGFSFGRDSVLRDWIYKDARDLQLQVDALRHLRKNENQKAMEMFESRLDGQLLLVVQPQAPYEFLTPRETAMLHKAMSDMRDYRSEYPHPGRFAEAVRQTLAQDPYK
jgi:hypothetical protein